MNHLRRARLKESEIGLSNAPPVQSDLTDGKISATNGRAGGMEKRRRTIGTGPTRMNVLGTSVLSALMLLGSSVLWLGQPAGAAKGPYGIVPLGSTNEGFPEGSNSATTGILDISGGPCVGVAINQQKLERLATLITLFHGSKEIARWEIYGEQRIAWVEAVGNYSVSASDYRNGAKVHFVVNASKNAAINLNPGCL
jgi:hypothetical protein